MSTILTWPRRYYVSTVAMFLVLQGFVNTGISYDMSPNNQLWQRRTPTCFALFFFTN